MQPLSAADKLLGLLLGTAVGDSLGLPLEGLSPRRAKRLFPAPHRQRFLGAWGMLSDDTEHTLFTAHALLAHPDNVRAFSRRLAWSLRWWLISLPAGTGFATARAGIKLWLGFPPSRSGVYSAGNGPAMRIAVLGAYFAAEPEMMEAYIKACTEITHTDPRALSGARAVAYTAAWIMRDKSGTPPKPSEFIALLRKAGDDEEWTELVEGFSDALKSECSVRDFAARLGMAEKGVSGYIYRTVPPALYAWYRHFGDYAQTVRAILDCGGDSDTCAAIGGALAGCVCGPQGIPQAWLNNLKDWPRDRVLLEKTAHCLARSKTPSKPPMYFWPAQVPRNIVFLVIVLLHGLRRLLPPY